MSKLWIVISYYATWPNVFGGARASHSGRNFENSWKKITNVTYLFFTYFKVLYLAPEWSNVVENVIRF